MNSARILLVAGLLFSTSLQSVEAQAAPCLRGINLSGAEFGKPGGAINSDYTYPSDFTFGYFAGQGFDTIRLPFQWERLQPQLMQDLDAGELNRLLEAVTMARIHGLTIILDPHNYARYHDQVIGSQSVPHGAFADFWRRLATVFANQSDVVFGLMNEPHDIPASQWLISANAAIAAIRGAAGARNLVLVPGTAWTGAHSWQRKFESGSNADVMVGIVDPEKRFAFEVHQYLDSDFSGTTDSCSRALGAVKALTSFSNWLRENNFRGYLGEFGAAGSPECLAGLSGMVNVVESNRDIWLGWSYWVAGDWWSPEEPLNIQPTEEGDRPQLSALKAALADEKNRKGECKYF